MKTNVDLSKIIDFPQKQLSPGNTIIILLDLQNEYISSGRAYALEDTDGCLEKCKLILEQARSCGFAIVHFRTILKSAFFNPGSYFSDWIKDFSPRSNEMIFERHEPSIFSNTSFNLFLQHIANPNLVLFGFTGERGCLATAIDASNRNVNLKYVHDASASSPLCDLSQEESHDYLSKLICHYSEVVDTDHILQSMTKTKEFGQA